MLGPHTYTPAPTARGWRTTTARPVGGQSGEGERLTSDAPHSGGRQPPRERPSATPTASCGTGAGSPRPHRPDPEHTGRGTPAARPRGRAVRGGTAPDTKRPSPQWLAPPPPGTAPHPPRGTQPPQGVQAKPGRWGPGPDRPQARQTEQGTGAGHAEGHRPRGTALPAPNAGTARGAHATPPRGGGSGRHGSASAHTRKGHVGTTRRATEPSSQNAKTAWNGVPASEGKGHPDGPRHAARDTQGGKGEMGETQHQVPTRAPRTGRGRRAHTDGALHPRWQ